MTKSRDLIMRIVAIALLAFAYACGPGQSKAEKRLQSFGTVKVPAVARFAAAEHFVSATLGLKDEALEALENRDRGEGVWLALMNEEFKSFLLNKTEKNVPSTTLNIYTHVAIVSKSRLVLEELGDGAETKLAHLWALLQKQPHGPHGKDGVLFCAPEFAISSENVFFIRGTDGNLWQVDVHWSELDRYNPWKMGWTLFAGPAQEGLIDQSYRVIAQ